MRFHTRKVFFWDLLGQSKHRVLQRPAKLLGELPIQLGQSVGYHVDSRNPPKILRPNALLNAADIDQAALVAHAWVFGYYGIVQTFGVGDLEVVELGEAFYRRFSREDLTQADVGKHCPVCALVCRTGFRGKSGSADPGAPGAPPVNKSSWSRLLHHVLVGEENANSELTFKLCVCEA